MKKEFKLLFSNQWKTGFFLVLVVILVIVTYSFVESSVSTGINTSYIKSWEGPFSEQQLEKARNTQGLQLGSYGFTSNPEPEAVMAQLYIEEWDKVTHMSSILDSDAAKLMKDQAKKIQLSPGYYHIPTWHNLFSTIGEFSSLSLSVQLFFLAMVILSSDFVCLERQLSTFLVTTGTIKGRSGMLRNKFFVVMILALVLALIIFATSLLPVILSGDFRHANVDIAEAMHKPNLWNTSLFKGVLILFCLWVLSVLLFVSQLMLLSSMVKSSIQSILLGACIFVALPWLVNSVIPVHLLIFPANIIAVFYTGLSSGINNDRLEAFLSYRPWLRANKWSVLIYVFVVSVLLSLLCLHLAQTKQEKWA